MLLIDGRSGSGKTELARAIVAGSPGAQLVRLDDLYPGWDGLDAGSQIAHDEILAAHHRPRWRRWDWVTGRHAEWHDLDPDRPLVVEGCGALSRDNRALASFGIWVALDVELRCELVDAPTGPWRQRRVVQHPCGGTRRGPRRRRRGGRLLEAAECRPWEGG